MSFFIDKATELLQHFSTGLILMHKIATIGAEQLYKNDTVPLSFRDSGKIQHFSTALATEQYITTKWMSSISI